MTTTAITATDLIRRYADDVGYVAEKAPAADLDGFIGQLGVAFGYFGLAGLGDPEDLDTASTLLGEALHADGRDRDTLLKRADALLAAIPDMTEEYREMVGD